MATPTGAGRNNTRRDLDISVALGGGGAKGIAHIGVLRFLERHGFGIRAIAGTSIGGLVACIYAAGFSPDQIQEMFERLDGRRLYGRGKGEVSSLLGLTRVDGWLHESLGTMAFEDLQVPCAVTAVDLPTSSEVIIQHGLLRPAILSTIAVPGVFPSVRSEELELIDGSLLNPVPVAVARALAPTTLPVVAVALNPPLGAPLQTKPLTWLRGVPHALSARLGNLRIVRALDIFLRSMEIGSRQISELRLQLEKPEVLIRPRVSEIGVLERVNVREVVKLGEEAAEESLPDLLRATTWRAGLSRRVFQRPVWTSKSSGRPVSGPR